MAFVAAMNRTKTGVNGEEVYTEEGVGDVRVSLFTMLTRGLSDAYIRKAVQEAPKEYLEDLFVMAMQTRDIRGGKGERQLFLNFMEALYERAPKAAEALIWFIPEYGCWRDLWEIHMRVPGLKDAIHGKVRAQWAEDHMRLKGQSLLAKWLPREGSATFPNLARVLANVLYPHIPYRSRVAHYRKAVAAMNRRIETVEVKMCEAEWATIDPERVPGRCFKIKKAALLNQKLVKARGSKKRVVSGEERVGTADRRQCAQQVKAFLEKALAGKATIKGAAVVQPHELVRETLNMRYADHKTDDVIEAQWLSIRNAAAAAGGFGKAVPMCDFSGSMSGIPMHVSLALGILISETNHVAFRDHILTFDSEPQWHSFAGLDSLQMKVNRVYNRCGQGLSTNFYKACMMILERMRAAAVPVGEEPEDLIVLTDMGWDAAHRTGGHGYSSNKDPWKTQVTRIHDAFAAHGYRPPRIVIWNLRAEYKDFHATAEDEGVVMISGWSPNVLSALQKDGVQTRTPLEGVRAVLDDPRYTKIREAVRPMLACMN